jgi:predicted metal-dependent phosphoesterase TrpH
MNRPSMSHLQRAQAEVAAWPPERLNDLRLQGEPVGAPKGVEPLSIPDIYARIRLAGGIVHSDGNIFFTRAEQFVAAAVLCGEDASSGRSELLEALKLARDYIAAELAHRQEAYAGYPHKWSTEQEDLAAVDAVIQKHTKEQK